MRKGKPRHVPMFLRSENKKIFFTFFSYFMPKNDLNFIFEHYDIGLIVLTKIHNIRKKYEDEKNNLQNQENKSDIDDMESFDEKVRTFFLNYKIKSNNEETIDTKKIKNEKHKKSKRNILNNENNREHLNKNVNSKSNSFDAQPATKEANNFSNENKELFKVNENEIINNNLKKKNKKVKVQENINNNESYLKSVKLELDKCNEENQSFTKNEYDNMNISNATNKNENLIEKISDLSKIENANIGIKSNKEQDNEKKENCNEIEKIVKKEENSEIIEKMEIKKEIYEDEEEMYDNKEIDEDDDIHKNNEKQKNLIMKEFKKVKKNISLIEGSEDKQKEKVNEDLKIEKESYDMSFPLKKKNETYKKFSKRINRKKINDFVDDHDDYCFYITDLCKKGTMLSLKKNELINDKNEKYKLSSAKFMETSENNKNSSFNESHPLNNILINTKLSEQFKENKTSESKNLQKSKGNFPQNSRIPINETILLPNAYPIDNDNNSYNLNNIENLQHKDNYIAEKNFQNSIYYMNGENNFFRNSVDENNVNYLNLNIKNKNNFENKTEITDEIEYSKFLENNQNVMNDKKKSYIKYEKTKKISQNKSKKKNYNEINKKMMYVNDQSNHDFVNNKTIQIKDEQLYQNGNYDYYTINNQNGFNNFYSSNINEIKNDINEQNSYTNNNNGNNINNNKCSTKNENSINQNFQANGINNYDTNFNLSNYQNNTSNISTNSNMNASNNNPKNMSNNNYNTPNQINNDFVNMNINNENMFTNYNININYLKNNADEKNYTQNSFDENDNNDDNNNNDNEDNYEKINIKNNVYINGNVNNNDIYFNNNDKINNYMKNYIRNNFPNDNAFNNNYSNSANITTYIDSCSNNNIYNMKNNDKNEFSGKNTSSYINKIRNVQYNSNNILQNEIFNKLNENNFKDQPIFPTNKSNSQSRQEEQLNRYVIPLANAQNNKKNVYKNSIYVQNDNIREPNFSFNCFYDDSNHINNNFSNLKKIKEEIEESTTNSKNINNVYQTKSKVDISNNKANMQNVYNNYSKIIENGCNAPNFDNNDMINNYLNLKYLSKNSLSEREEKQKEILEKKNNVKEEREDYDEQKKTQGIIEDNENIKEYNYLINAIKNENPSFYNINRNNVNKDKSELDNNSFKTQNQSEELQFSDEKKKYIIKNNNNIIYSTSKNMGGKKGGNQISNYNYVENDLEKKRKKIIQDTFEKNTSYHQLKDTFLYNEENSLKKIQSENKNSLHHYIDSENNLMDENSKIVDQFLCNNYDIKNIHMNNESSLLFRNEDNNKYIVPNNIENDKVDNNINDTSCLKEENGSYKNESHYKIKNVNKSVVQNSKSYIMTKNGCFKNNHNNYIEMKTNLNSPSKYSNKSNYETSLKNIDNNVDIIENNIEMIKNVNNNNNRNNIGDSKVSINEDINSRNGYINNDDTNINNYMMSDEVNNLEYSKFYTDDNAETKSFSELNEQNSSKNTVYVKKKEDFEISDLGLVTDIENYNYKNKANNYNKEMKYNVYDMKVLQDLDNYIISESKNYNQEFIDNFSCNAKLERANINSDNSKNMHDTFYKKSYSKNDNYNDENNTYTNNVNKNFKNNSKDSFTFYNSSNKYSEEKNLNDENNKYVNNNTSSLYENINNSNLYQNLFDNKDRIMFQSAKSLNFPTSDIYCDNNKTIATLNEKDHMDSQNFLNNNFNKINENFLKKNMESNNNMYNMHNASHHNYPNEGFFNREEENNEGGNLTSAQSQYYFNNLSRKKIMNNLNTNSLNEILRFNNSSNISNVNNTDDVTNIHNVCQNSYNTNINQNHSTINGNAIYSFNNNFKINNIDYHNHINSVNISNCNTYNNYNNGDAHNNIDIIKMKNTNNEKHSVTNNFCNLNNMKNAYSSKFNSTDSQLNPVNESNVSDSFNETQMNAMDKCKNISDGNTPYNIENINYLMNKIDNSNSFYDNYKFMNIINYNEKMSSDENIYKDSNLNLKKMKNLPGNNTSSFKNPYLYMNKNMNPEEVDTITYENINEMNNNIDHMKNDSSSTCCDNNNSNNDIVKGEMILNGLYDNISFDNYKNNTSLIMDFNKNKQNNNFYESFNADLKDKQKNSNDNFNNSTNLINCKGYQFNSKNTFNSLSNNINSLNDLKNMNDLNNVNCLNDFKDTDTLNKLISCNDKNNTSAVNNFKNINELNRILGVKNINDAKTDNMNIIFGNMDKVNIMNSSENLKNFTNNNMNNISDNINKNFVLDNSFINTLGNNTNIPNKEHVDFDPNNINFLKNYNFNSYMFLLQLNKINDYYNSINNKNIVDNSNFNLNIPIQVPHNNMNIFANQKKLEFDKQSNKSYINEINSNCEKNAIIINNCYASPVPNIVLKNNKESNVNISKSNISDDYINNYKQLYVLNSDILNIDSKKNTNMDFNKNFVNYENQIKYMNNSKGNIVNYDNYNMNVQNKNLNSIFSLDSLKCNLANNNSNYINILNNICHINDDNSNTQGTCTNNKLMLNDKNKKNNHNVNELYELKHVNLNENRGINSIIPVNFPIKNYYNFQLLLNVLKGKQLYNSFNHDTGKEQNNNCMNLKNNKKNYSISSVGFSNRSKRWTICPSYICCNSALCRFKLTCNFKFLQFNQAYNTFNIPYAIYNCYKNIMNNYHYFTSTLCPQQTYLSKHSAQEHETIFNVYWHLLNNEKYKYIQNIILFLDSNLYTRAVWLLKKGHNMNDFEVQRAEKKLIKLMLLVFKFTYEFKNDNDKYEHIKSFLYSIKNSHINFEIMNRFLFY
ncbi:sporozoite and liver stage asparagine-rich protein, putative [Plasmodium relictum]|uniref:Sporozoite and liver stage asparagine-rich protein, putative n=1 Tax=Plasmodium relictum TaxID=85471 RepID=A0A1J1H6F2_PLARL|nr:sporozoite and liver stage asparagine-rich protein, putative [Plasmodium relictum]CRH00340.1 sporozoite and liver stage asparagine-rich protein, putative [Plasmodium relictum]